MRTVTALVGLLRWAIRYELSLYRSLYRWVARRPDVPADATAFPYVGAVAVLLWAFIVVSAIELVVLHLLLPWETVRLVADVIGIWGLVWMLGYAGSLNVHPHLVSDSALRIRVGTGTDITVPRDAIASVSVRERSRESSRAVQLDRDDQGDVLNLVTASRTNVEIKLRGPLAVPLRKGAETVVTIRFYADDARGLAARLREQRNASDARR